MKLSSIETQLNKIVIFIIAFTLLICILCTVMGMLFWSKYKPNNNNLNMDYIFYTKSEDQGIVLEIFKTAAAFFTIFNTLIPISIMIIMEVVKGLQVIFLEKDPLLAEDVDDKVKILSMKLHEDLGSVKYIFTDKTGTLTRNEMDFKACSVFTKLFDEGLEKEKTCTERRDTDSSVNFSKNSSEVIPTGLQQSKKSVFSETFDPRLLKETLKNNHPIDIIDLGNTPFYSMKEAAIEFCLNIALNHNVMTEIEDNSKVYTGSSPDEVILVTAAKELGIEFIERSNNLIKLKINNEELTFEVLYRFEYTSTRMRSSILVRDKYNAIKLYMKGADSIILKKIDEYSKNFLFKITKEHVDKFAKKGLRTLCFSMKFLDPILFTQWEQEYKRTLDHTLKDKNLVNLLEETISKLEDDMILLGVSGLEDKLQEDVQDVIQDFIEAGINVWMLTGDKLDTAESIGYSCKLFNDDTEVFKIKSGNTRHQTFQNIKDVLKKMETIEKELLEFKIEKKKKKKKRGSNVNNNLKKNKKIEIKDDDEMKPGNDFKSIQNTLVNSENIMVLNNRLKNNFNPGKNLNSTINHFKSNYPDHNFSNTNKIHEINSPKPVMFMKNKSPLMESSPDLIKSDLNKLHSIDNGRTHLEKSNSFYDAIGNPLNIKDINKQIKNEKMQFIGTQVNIGSNLVTLNFKRNNTEFKSKERQEKIRPASSNFHSVGRKNLNNRPDVNPPSKIDNYEMEESIVDDVDIIRFMIDKNFFEENFENASVDNDNFTFLKKVMSKQTIYMKDSENENENQQVKNDHPPPDSSVDVQNFKNLRFENQNLQIKFGNGNVHQMRSPIFQNFNSHNDYENFNKIKNNHLQLPNPLNELKEIDNDFNHNDDFANLFEHYKNKIKILEPQNPYNIFNFNFTDNNDSNYNKEIFMKNFGLIIEGSAISECLEADISAVFWQCLQKARSVICCRCGPIQKSEVVNYIKTKTPDITLSIGDGGNDVNMIKAANVGVGIFGKEGYQAAFSSDYAISQFKYLRRLIFVHGRYSLLRNSYFVNFFFYKNLMFTFSQFWFSFFSGFSGTLLWDEWYYLGYNSFMTTIPASIRMLYEEDIDITFEGYPDRHLIQEY